MSDGTTKTSAPGSEPRISLKLKEFELLRQEIEQRSQEGRTMERNVVVVATAVVTFLVSKDVASSDAGKELLSLAWFVPPLVSFLALTRWIESAKLIKGLASYIAITEQDMLGEKGGWEVFLAKLREKPEPELRFSSTWNVVFWETAIGAPAFLALHQGFGWLTPWAALAGAALGIGIGWALFEAAKLDKSGPITTWIKAWVRHVRNPEVEARVKAYFVRMIQPPNDER